MAIAHTQLLREMSTELTSLFDKAYTEQEINKKKKI